MADPEPADFVRIVSELDQRLKGVHLLCARQSEEDYEDYEANPAGNEVVLSPDQLEKLSKLQDQEQIKTEKHRMLEHGKVLQQQRREEFVRLAKERCVKVLDALKDAIFHGPNVDVQTSKARLDQMLDEALHTCDLCIPKYYIGKRDLQDRLRQQEYTGEEIVDFFDVFNMPDIHRVTTHLDRTRQLLLQMPEKQRKLGNLDETIVYSIFEALSCDPFLKSENLLQQHFDEVFKLIQGAKTLKSRAFLPAATFFLFQTDRERFSWAATAWVRVYQRSPNQEEWEWTVKEPLQKQFTLATSSQHSKVVWTFWNGLRFILRRLDPDDIVHKLGGIEPDVHNMALRHLAVNTIGLKFILECVRIILEKVPTAFWEALGPIPAVTFIENVFSSPTYTKLLQETSPAESEPEPSAEKVISWMWPFLASLNPANLPPACRSLVSQLFPLSFDESLTVPARVAAFAAALKVLNLMFERLRESPTFLHASGRITLAEVIEVVYANTHSFFGELDEMTAELMTEDTKHLAQSIIFNTLDVQCLALEADYRSLIDGHPLEHGTSLHKAELWALVIEQLNSKDTALSESTLRGITCLVGAERYVAKRGSKGLPGGEQYNSVFEKTGGVVVQILEKVTDFPAPHLDHLFKTTGSSRGLIGALFASDKDVYLAAREVVTKISGQTAPKEALSHLLRAFPKVTTHSIASALQRIASLKTFAPIQQTLTISFDILDILTDNQSGLLRVQTLSSEDARVVQELWYRNWQLLQTIFRETEAWNDRYGSKEAMTDLCRDAMQYAEMLFEQYDVFASAARSANPEQAATIDKFLLEAKGGSPASTLTTMSKWLRLRDEYLSSTLAKLVTKILGKLSSHKATIPDTALQSIQTITTNPRIKTILSPQQKAEIVRALETYHDKPIRASDPQKKQQKLTGMMPNLQIDSRGGSGASTPASDDSDVPIITGSNVISQPKSMAQALATRTMSKTSSKVGSTTSRASGLGKIGSSSSIGPKSTSEKDAAAAFVANRNRQAAEKKAKLAQEKLQREGKGGSALAGLGVMGKDHSVRNDSIMVSSSESEESYDEEDEAIFGSRVAKGDPASANALAARNASGLPQPAGPVKKIKMQLQRNDMRSRLAPDLSGLHQTLLDWDFFADTDLPPGSTTTDYTLVSNTFATVEDYQKTFEPLLVLEGWQSFRRAREEGNFKSFDIKISNRLSVDNSIEVNATLLKGDPKELGFSVADVLLLSKHPRPETAPDAPHCLARIKEKGFKQGAMEIVFRVNWSQNKLLSSLIPGQTLHAVSVLSLTSLEREYGALHALKFYDLAPEIIKAKPSPILEYEDKDLQPLVENYKVNPAQARAVRSALDNDCFTLIQGPPGSGKTKTICALVGAMISNSMPGLASPASFIPLTASASVKKILVCAPSNAAVDELVMRFKDGMVLMNGRKEKLSVVRLGRSDAINANVKDVILEEMIKAKLAQAVPKQQEDIHKYMMEHKEVSDRFHELRKRVEEMRAKGQSIPTTDSQTLDALKRKKGDLSLVIDRIRDKTKAAAREAGMERRRIQQAILEGAHILCATLSGSGHDIFQGLNIEFETVIIDEAAQSIELSALIPLKYGCSKCILVGDPKQLPPTVLSKEAARFQFEQSLFARMEKSNSKDIHLLDTQYRMHPEISLYPSKTFYDGKLKDGAGLAELRKRPWHHADLLGPYRFFDVQGMSSNAPSGHSLINTAEIEVAMKLYERLISDCPQYQFHGKIGIITPYKGQLMQLRSRFARKYTENILSAVEFNTTDAFQGRESEIIIFSCVRATTKGIGFLNDIRRMNVGLTRAKCSLWVLGNSKSLISGRFWKGLVTDAQARNRYTDGDVLGKLSRPLLTIDMMKDDVEMGGMSPERRHDSVKSEPSRRESIKLETKSKKSDAAEGKTQDPRLVAKANRTPHVQDAGSKIDAKVPAKSETAAKGPISAASQAPIKQTPKPPVVNNKDHSTKGKTRLEEKASLDPGSDAQNSCFRCKSPNHVKNQCPKPRCLKCGEIGHEQSACKSSKVLNAFQAERVKKKEEMFQIRKQEEAEKRDRRNMDGHDLPTPSVMSALPPSDNKRKRDEGVQPAPRSTSKVAKADDPRKQAGFGQNSAFGSSAMDPPSDAGAGLGAGTGTGTETRPASKPGAVEQGPTVPTGPKSKPAGGLGGPPKVFKKGGGKGNSMFIEKKKR